MSGTEALFVGAALTATSVGITARVFGDLRALASIEARTVLGAAVADDVIGLVILKIVSRIASSGSPSIGDIASTVSIALAFLMLTTLVGVRLVPGLISLVSRVSRGAGTLVAVGFAFALGVAELANAAKLAPIVGVFIAGLALGRSEAATRVRRELTPVGRWLPVQASSSATPALRYVWTCSSREEFRCRLSWKRVGGPLTTAGRLPPRR
jgi:Kef-type K+ transport system membrane component KefB